MKSNQIVSRHVEANFACWLLYFWPCVSQLLPNPGARPQSVIRQITKMTARLKLECRSDFVDWLYLSWSLTEQPQHVGFARKAVPRYVFSPPAEDVLGEQRFGRTSSASRWLKRDVKTESLVSGDSTQNIFTNCQSSRVDGFFLHLDTLRECRWRPSARWADGQPPQPLGGYK